MIKKIGVVCLLVIGLFAVGTWSLVGETKADDAPQIVVSIKPLHGIVSAITKGVAKPTLLLDGPQSPHSFSLKPSQATELNAADFVFLADEQLELPLMRAARSFPDSVKVVALIDAPGMELLPIRQGGQFDAHDHSHGGHDHGDEGHDHHAHEGHDHKGHGHKDHAHKDHGHDDHGHDDHKHKDHAHHKHGHGKHTKAAKARDPHFWLDPENMRWVGAYVVDVLSERFPEHRETFQANANMLDQNLIALEKSIKSRLAQSAGRPFLVFHDAFQYFEKRFSLQTVGAISINPEVLPGARRLAELRKRVKDSNVVCVFSEPQFQSRVIDTVIEGADVKKGVVDPLGSKLDAGPGHYQAMLKNIAAAFDDCLRPGS